MKRLGIGIILTLALIVPAQANFILFHTVVGDWSITCSRPMLKEDRSCRLTAPKGKLGAQFAPNLIEIREWKSGQFQVIVTVRDRFKPNIPLTLQVDGLGVHGTSIRADGIAWWSGNAAAKIILEMQAGRKIMYRVQTLPDSMPRDMRVSLVSFKRAFEIYRGVMRSHMGMAD